MTCIECAEFSPRSISTGWCKFREKLVFNASSCQEQWKINEKEADVSAGRGKPI